MIVDVRKFYNFSSYRQIVRLSREDKRQFSAHGWQFVCGRKKKLLFGWYRFGLVFRFKLKKQKPLLLTTSTT